VAVEEEALFLVGLVQLVDLVVEVPVDLIISQQAKLVQVLVEMVQQILAVALAEVLVAKVVLVDPVFLY
jgi:hypothetical protein